MPPLFPNIPSILLSLSLLTLLNFYVNTFPQSDTARDRLERQILLYGFRTDVLQSLMKT